ncbi:ABC transporter substrate-binding protein [soil metagenome]
MLRKWLAPLVLLSSLLFVACQPVAVAPVATPASPGTGTTAAPTANLADGCVTTYDAAVDYFPEKTKPTYTDGFSVEYHNNYKVVTVKTPWQGAKEPLQYALVQCGTPAPTAFKKEQIIEVPVKRFVSMSTTYLPFLDELNLLDRLVGLDDATYVNNEKVAKLAADGKLKMIGFGAKVNVEQALDLNPDLIMTYAMGAADSDAHPLLIEAGLKVVVNAEWLDTSPLGRAEWGKFLALFFKREVAADAMFAKTATAYEKLVAQAATVKTKPTVFTDTDYQGTWYVAGGQSFGAHFLADAGATYLWADDTSSGSSPLAFEAVFDKAKDADVWLNTGFLSSLNDLKAADARYADFAAFKQGNVWNNNVRANANGGNDYYESAIAHPDVVLADLIKILHPELLPDHKLVYYQQLK